MLDWVNIPTNMWKTSVSYLRIKIGLLCFESCCCFLPITLPMQGITVTEQIDVCDSHNTANKLSPFISGFGRVSVHGLNRSPE